MNEIGDIRIQTGISDATVSAILVTEFDLIDLLDVDISWQPALLQMEKQAVAFGTPEDELPDYLHWLWMHKHLRRQNQGIYGIKYGVEIQGLLHIERGHTSRITGSEIAYLTYIQAAPWNDNAILKKVHGSPRYPKIGNPLMATAIQWSREEGFDGRIGLHSLTGAERFYRERAGMRDFGPDYHYQGLVYFEMTPEIANAF